MKEFFKKNASIVAALGANVGVTLAKFIGFLLTRSTAMLNESIHSLIDCVNEVTLLYGKNTASSESSDNYNFGTSRQQYFWSMVVAGFLFFGGGLVGIWEAGEKLHEPTHSVEMPWLSIIIILIGLVLESFSFKTALKEIAELNTKKLPLFKFLHESRHSEILIIFAEDFCALIGLVFALIGTIAAWITGNSVYDAVSALAIGILLTVASIFLTNEFKSLIIGEPLVESDIKLLQKILEKPEIAHVLDIKTLHNGPHDILIGLKLEYSDTVTNITEFTNKLENEIRDSFPSHYNEITIFVELDKYVKDYVDSTAQ